ncbi:receptor-interacting serine/threonine-protein kinase 1 [Aulostomus maculatus]
MATAPLSLHMKSTDLIKKEHLDYGGFGDVYLCYHVTLGHVVLKTLYTGPLRNEESKRSLLEEGNIMASLNHERVVKLLGVIMEDRQCSLVMELMPRGNLLVLLEKATVPVSVKGRIIVEILEGMVYLTEKNIIHKDLKPENILVDKDFHIKIADLGLATCKTWSKLTKEESRRKSVGRTTGARGAGTLSYMAPEHLESIHTVSTEKSDVYSFAIVVWVILTGEEPYANARSEDHISQCVRNGDRPANELIADDTPAEIIQLMKRCWENNPKQRPTFKEGWNLFHPFYLEKLEPHIKSDLIRLRELYEGQDDVGEKMKSLSMTPECFAADCPASLVSTERSVPVEASIEDLDEDHSEAFVEPVESHIQTDAKTEQSPALEDKLDRELQYHKYGSYNCENQPDAAICHQDNLYHFLPQNFSAPNNNIRQPEEDRMLCASSVHSWTKAEPVQPSSQEDIWCQRNTAHCESVTSFPPVPSHLPTSSSPSLSHLNQQHPHSHYDRQQSWPTYPVFDTAGLDLPPGRILTPTKSGSLQDPGSLYIQNARGIQIGNNNTLSIHGYESSVPTTNGSISSPIKDIIQIYEEFAVTEEHLDLLRDNIGTKWKRCARRLGLTSVEIETIEHDFRLDGLPEMVHQMLERWKMKEGRIGCTIGKLCRAIEGNVKVDVILQILDSFGSSP